MAIGLDIGSSAVRAVQLERRRGRPFQLSRHREAELPAGAVVDGEVAEPDAVADVLREVWAQAGLRDRTVALGLASPRVTVRQMDLPALPEGELGDAVRLQAEDQLPMPVEQALLDHMVVERYDVVEERSNVRVLLVAAERDMVERLLAAVTAAKLRPALVDLDAFALLRSLTTTLADGEPPAVSDGAEAIVDVGAAITKIAVHRAGNPLFVRMVRLGGDAATRELQRILELSWEEAEHAKLAASEAMAAGRELDPEDERVGVLQGGVQRVISEVRHSLDFFRREHDVEVLRVLLSGRGSLAPNLADRLEAVLELPVELGNPLHAIDVAEARRAPNGFHEEERSLGVAVGLAMGLLR
ncbi:MAG TPA: type IV pilus assembly protein PilM [Egibacteraceae bacterium]|nr:type IV pilus assembly protein PilM [Egibacteraceae bacterium]